MRKVDLEENMLDKIKEWIFTIGIKSAVRKLMAFLSGVLVGVVGLDPETVQKFCSSGEAVLIAVILYVAAQVWSYLDKKKAAK